MKIKPNKLLIKALAIIFLSILSLLPVEVTVTSAVYSIGEDLTLLSTSNIIMPVYLGSENNVPLSYFSSADNRSYWSVQAQQTSGSKGKVIITPTSGMFTQSDIECRFGLTTDISLERSTNLFSQMDEAEVSQLMNTTTKITLDSYQQTFIGDFVVKEPGSYTVLAILTSERRIVGSDTIRFRLQGDSDVIPQVRINDGTELSLDWSSIILGWEGLDLTGLTAQSVKVLSLSDNMEVTIGSTANSLRVKGGRSGENIDVEVHVTYNEYADDIRIKLQVDGNSIAFSPTPSLPIPRVPDPPNWIYDMTHIIRSADVGYAMLIVLLCFFSICFAVFFYRIFIKRITGSFVIRCKCGAISQRVDMKSPLGSSINLYKLLKKALKKRENHDAEVIREIANNNDNRKNLSEIRIYIVKGSDKRLHYAFRKAGNRIIINDTPQKVYPDFGKLNTNLTVSLSFIDGRR